MSRFWSASNAANYIRGTISGGLPQPFTMFCWVRHPDYGVARRAAMALSQEFPSANADNSAWMRVDGSTVDTVECLIRTSSATSREVTAATPDLWNNAWVPWMGSFSDAANFPFDVFVGDETDGAGGPNRNIGGAGEIILGQDAAQASPFNGYIAEVAVYNIALDSVDFAALKGGANPTAVQGANLVGYWSMATDTGGTIPDQSGNSGPALNVTGAVPFDSEHPVVDPPAVSDDITNVNGIDFVERDFTSNQINGVGFSTATGVTIGGVAQSGFVIVSDTLVQFDTEIDAAADLKFGAQTLTLARSNGNLQHAITLIPPEDRTYGDVSGLPWPVGSRSIFEGASPAVANGDQFEYESVTNSGDGNDVLVNPDGTYLVGGGGTTPQDFKFRLWRAADTSQWSTDFTSFVNFTPVITAVSIDDVSDITEAPVQIDGDHFGETQLQSKVYLNMAGGGIDGNEVEQAVQSWSNTQIMLTGWTLGTLPGGTDMEIIVEVE